MIRLDGSSILVVDPDLAYGLQLVETLSFHGARSSTAELVSEAKLLLEKFEYDLVISKYCLPDGSIHQLIDWCAKNLKTLPIFTCIAHPYTIDSVFLKKFSIAEVFDTSDSRKILGSVANLLFDFNQFKESLSEILVPEEILIEVRVGDFHHLVQPIEVTRESVFFDLDSAINDGMFGILKFSIKSGSAHQKFLVTGHFEVTQESGQMFRINPKYMDHWSKFIDFLNLNQSYVNNFLNKVSGL